MTKSPKIRATKRVPAENRSARLKVILETGELETGQRASSKQAAIHAMR
jgi:deoxyribose-phosphate aldolase